MEVFKEISVGGKTAEQLIQQLSEKGIQFNKYAHMLFEHPSFSANNETRSDRLFKVNLLDLQLEKPSVFQDIVAKAEDFGLKLCPLHLAAYLRLGYLDQPEGPYLTVASARLESDESYPRGFYVRNLEKTLWLRGYCASDDWEFPLDMEFIFQEGV